MKTVETALDDFRLAIMAVNAAMAELRQHDLKVLYLVVDDRGVQAQIYDPIRFAQVFPDYVTVPFQSKDFSHELVAEYDGIKFTSLCPAEREVG